MMSVCQLFITTVLLGARLIAESLMIEFSFHADDFGPRKTLLKFLKVL